jgi:CDP-6-deoxy-D-xylo-4-hexulose-3-dehydrase
MTMQPTEYRYPLARVSYGAEEIAAVVATLEAGRTTMGPRVAEFERRFASYIGAKHAVMVNSGSSADLLLALSLSAIERTGEIVVPAVTWPTQVWACVIAGLTVRLVDVDPETLQFDAADLEAKIGPKTTALFPAHILGNVGDMDRVVELAGAHDLVVLEDCCEALGAYWHDQHVGTLGDAGAFSFFFSHLLSTMEGGMVVTNVDQAARRVLPAHQGAFPVRPILARLPLHACPRRPLHQAPALRPPRSEGHRNPPHRGRQLGPPTGGGAPP